MIVVVPVVMAVPVTSGMKTDPEGPPAIADPKPPTRPGVVADMKTPGAITRVIIVG